MRVQDRAVIVTGASSGIGRETALLLAKRGARVWAVGRNEGRLKEVADEDSRIEPFVADVKDDDDRKRLVDAVGEVDVLINNAGLGWTGTVEEMPAADVRNLYETNVLSLIDLTQRVLPGMLARKRGHIVNVASIGGYVAAPPFTVYCSTKFAVQGFTDGLRRETLGRGVDVTLVNPGPINTRFLGRANVGDTAEVDAHTTPGVPAWVVGRAIARAIRMGGMPGYDTIAVPRVLGMARIGAAPGISMVLDAASRLTRGIDLTRFGI
jgi:short-subunit dehydrogenase